jgi:hypothetical protein
MVAPKAPSAAANSIADVKACIENLHFCVAHQQRTGRSVPEITLVHIGVRPQHVIVMAGLSRSRNGVASLAYVPAISIQLAGHCHGHRDARDKRGHDSLGG